MKTTASNAAGNAGGSRHSASRGHGHRPVYWTTAAGILSALGICAACCLLPFVLVSIGIAGVWVGSLDLLAPYKWLFIAMSTVLLSYGFYITYWKAKPTCPPESGCGKCRSSRSIRVALWVGTILAVSGLTFEQIEPMLLRN
jgi:mercuric ion transport protein